MNTTAENKNPGVIASKAAAENSETTPRPKRARKATLLKLQWLAERLRKVERIKKAVADGSYQVDSSDVAKAMLNLK